MKYDTESYWKSLHKQWAGRLRSVGHPWLSEEFNQLKYQSESAAFLVSLEEMRSGLPERKTLSILDVGVGTGYWTGVSADWCSKAGLQVDASAVDISEVALESVKSNFPSVKTSLQDLRSVDVDMFSNTFDLVISCYCLHHLVRIEEFLNGFKFACRSVREKGFLLVMDPVLTRPFTYLDTIHFESFEGNGIARHLYLLDDIASKEGLSRYSLRPAVSFILNGNIDGHSRFGFWLCHYTWKMMQIFYRRGSWTKRISGILMRLDQVLKKAHLAFSSSICVYRKMG